jgi:serine/threonine-protein kinase HipA
MAKDLEALFNRIRALEIDTPQGHSGRLSRESRFVFNYRDTAEESTAVSLVMPVRSQSYASGDLMGVFAMNRPEGYLRYIIEERLKRLGAPDDMLLLWLSGGNGIGRLDYRLPGEDRPADTGERLDTLLRSPLAHPVRRSGRPLCAALRHLRCAAENRGAIATGTA